MNKKIIGILIFMIVFCSTVSSASLINQPSTSLIKDTEVIVLGFSYQRIKGDITGYYRDEENILRINCTDVYVKGISLLILPWQDYKNYEKYFRDVNNIKVTHSNSGRLFGSITEDYINVILFWHSGMVGNN